uniref:Aminotransferase-like plant mobile domain-containing protein n=1 Tax=Fagus sylvatica TaxID=28930 RepID=A0A2N9GQH8_FAGSY
MSTHPQATQEVQPRIRHHCIVSKLRDVNKSLSEECKSQLQTTPFGWLLNLHCNIEASGRMLEVMVASWNANECAFQVGDRLIPFTLYDIALILGLPMRGEPIDCNQSVYGRYAWGKAVYEFLVSGLNRAAASKQAKKAKGNLHIQGCTALLQIWACEHLGIGQKNAEINQPFPRFLAWTHQKMFAKKAMEAFSNNANVLSVLVAMPWEQEFNVVEEAMETLQETHGSSHTANAILSAWRMSLNHVKGLVATIQQNQPPPSQNVEQNQPPPSQNVEQNHPPPSQNIEQNQPPIQTQLPIQTPIVDLPSSPSPSKVYKRGKPAKKKAKAAMVDLASSPSKRDNEGEAAAAVVDLVSSPSKGPTTPTADDEAVLADFRKKWGGATRRATRRRSNEVAISTKTYEITGQEVSSLLGDQAQDDGSRWISTATMILGSAQSTSGQRGKRTRKGKQPVQDDQPRPESGFRPSLVRALPENCKPGN